MYAAERQQLLAERLEERGRLSVVEVAEEFSVSGETVRRDLAVLERGGVARRVHGGAVAANALRVLEPGLVQRNSTRADEKARIAAAAAAYLPQGDGSVIFDAGTTINKLADHLPTDRTMTVITHAIPVAAKLSGAQTVNLHLLGGRVRRVTAAAVGNTTVTSLDSIHVDVSFIGTNAANPNYGLSTPDSEEAAVKRALVGSGRLVIVLADSSKLDVEHAFAFAGCEDIDVLVTDTDADPQQVRAFREQDIDVILA